MSDLQYRALLLAAALLTSSGCGTVPVDPGPDVLPLGTVLGLAQARMVWEHQGINDYDATMERICECPAAGAPVVVAVRSGTVTVNTPSGEPMDTSIVGAYPTIDGLFYILQDAFDRDADEIRVRYDAGLGYPLEFHIDFFQDAIDDELGYAISRLVVR